MWVGGLFVGLVILTMVTAFWLYGAPAPGVTPQNYKRPYAGMTVEEAETISGCGWLQDSFHD
jgi:hypothetical protein